MISIDRLAQNLIANKRVEFSFHLQSDNHELALICVKECEEYDLAEYDVEYQRGEFFQIGPAKQSEEVVPSELCFPDLQAAGDAILKRRAEILNIPWGEDAENDVQL
ncbi:hypothetical protein Plim_4062 [Planctopirus limnophila DSM 3776]|uniref:Uncharacterized protein n=1 Tax=Planctopirus limnophila (strain ATCC 43296 / DSM 3776 / IFAM 1008 / Mu 290) TaxID=521674 RepID=D5SY80_PLAL2|nr:hypothetical protein [Planctopirus limnophila]ADG69873.1 hypothetical protein Plim_4062 [Planctopirus limnophila DSM 3776]